MVAIDNFFFYNNNLLPQPKVIKVFVILKISEVPLQCSILPSSLLMLFIEMFSLVFFLHRLVYSDKQEDG